MTVTAGVERIDVDRSYDAHLARVSRSFAFCIPRLDQPFRAWVTLSYLLLRVLDTIEDSQWPRADLRERQFDTFGRLIDGERVDVYAWIASFPSTIPEGERLLLADVRDLVADLHVLPAPVRAVIVRTLHGMSRGMRWFLGRPRGMRIETVGEANLYCFFVAGLVGEMLTTLFARTSALRLTSDVLVDAHRFGRFLQKVNILKDAATDCAAGRDLVPDGLAGSLRDDATGAFAYLLQVPAAERGYRLFCAWSLFLGLLTVSGRKDRTAVERLLGSAEAVIADDAALRTLFTRMAASLPDSTYDPTPFTAPVPAAGTSLSIDALRALGLDVPLEIAR